MASDGFHNQRIARSLGLAVSSRQGTLEQGTGVGWQRGHAGDTFEPLSSFG